MKVSEHMRQEIGGELRAAEEAHQRATALLSNPKGKQPESLEDALNALQEAGWRARRAYSAYKDTILEEPRLKKIEED